MLRIRNILTVLSGKKSNRSEFAQYMYDRFHLNIKNEAYYQEAITIKGLSKVNEHGVKINNERLEFLGDALLESIISEKLYREYPRRDEGFLTEMRSNMVKRRTLNMLGSKMGLTSYIGNKSVEGTNLLGNAVEALIGAVFLDLGFEKCREFVLYLYQKYVNEKVVSEKEVNYKSLLLEWGQKNRKTVEFQLVEESRFDNKIKFQSRVFIDGKEYDYGVGFSKKESERKAAMYTMRRLKKSKML